MSKIIFLKIDDPDDFYISQYSFITVIAVKLLLKL